jgi:integrase
MTEKPARVRVGDRVTIYPRGKRRIWCADFWRDGRHCRRSLRTANKKYALQRALKLDAELASGIYQQPPPPVTTRQAAADYLTHLKTEGRARKTLVKYRGILDTLIVFVESHRAAQLGHLTASLFDRFRAHRAEGRHPKTMYTEGVVVKQFLRWAKSRKLIVENPVVDVKLSKPPLQPKEGPGMRQVESILAELPEPKRTMVALLAFTGMRAGELQRLRPEDVEREGGWVHVRSRPGAETKTRQSRKVPLHARLLPLLEALPTRPRPWLFTAAASKWYPRGDHHVNIKHLNEDFLRVVQLLGLPAGRVGGFTLHSLRHFFETFSVNAAIPQRVVDAWLGHSSDRSMAAVYYRLTDEDSQRFMKLVPFGTGVPAAGAGEEN